MLLWLAIPLIIKLQKIIPGESQTANSQTEWGVEAVNTFAGALSHPLAGRFGQIAGNWLPAFRSTIVWHPPKYASGKA